MRQMKAFAAIAALLLLVACDAVDTIKEGFAHAEAVSTKLEASLGLKSQVGFNWNNGALVSVTVTFTGVPNTPSLTEITARTKDAVLAEFKQTPRTLVVAFSVAQ
jgi:hypothetical protein